MPPIGSRPGRELMTKYWTSKEGTKLKVEAVEMCLGFMWKPTVKNENKIWDACNIPKNCPVTPRLLIHRVNSGLHYREAWVPEHLHKLNSEVKLVVVNVRTNSPRVKEKRIEDAVVRWAVERGCEVVKLPASTFKGIPDREFYLPGGLSQLMEFKRPGEVPTRIQKAVHSRFERLGHKVYVVTSVEQGIAILRRAMEASRLSKSGDEVPA
jgi:hypothetical protein